MKKAAKTHGRIYTPDFIVRNILDMCGYEGEKVLGKYVIDNSCGDGAFLIEVVRRYCIAAQAASMSNTDIAGHLTNFVHGIEIDPTQADICRKNLDKLAASYGVFCVRWNIICGNALIIRDFDNKMDFVVGNPPYVRVHNLDENYCAVKSFTFTQGGMTDLFIVFYEIGLNMLNENGVLGYITPSSIFNSLAGKTMRQHLLHNKSLRSVVDLKHFQPFAATTYTAILLLGKTPNDIVRYFEYDAENLEPFAVSELGYEDFVISGNFVFGSKPELAEFKQIASIKPAKPAFVVKNGFATLFDDFFIGDYDFDEHTIPIIKASTGKITRCLYPYDNHGNIVPYEILAQNPQIHKHYEKHEERLKKRALDKDAPWHGFGRSQGIKDVYRQKFAINTLIRNVNDIKLQPCPPRTGVYSGLYILTDYGFDELRSILCSDDFVKYISQLGKYKSGGYYTFSSKDLAQYLNYMHAEGGGFENGQFTLS